MGSKGSPGALNYPSPQRPCQMLLLFLDGQEDTGEKKPDGGVSKGVQVGSF